MERVSSDDPAELQVRRSSESLSEIFLKSPLQSVNDSSRVIRKLKNRLRETSRLGASAIARFVVSEDAKLSRVVCDECYVSAKARYFLDMKSIELIPVHLVEERLL
jgi:hypothetical protein